MLLNNKNRFCLDNFLMDAKLLEKKLTEADKGLRMFCKGYNISSGQGLVCRN